MHSQMTTVLASAFDLGRAGQGRLLGMANIIHHEGHLNEGIRRKEMAAFVAQ